jgi:hypothetical protein
VLTAAAAALVVAGYVSASRVEIDATTEAAGLVVIGSGLIAVMVAIIGIAIAVS